MTVQPSLAALFPSGIPHRLGEHTLGVCACTHDDRSHHIVRFLDPAWPCQVPGCACGDFDLVEVIR